MSAVNVGGQIEVAVKKVTENVCRQVVSRGTRAVNEIRNAELNVLKGARSGKVYKKPGGGTYRASAPGEPPARRTGNLRMNWDGRVEGGASGGTSVSLTAVLESMETKYNDYMEHGTPGGMIAPRPYVERIRDKALPKIEAIYNEPYV